MKKLIFIALALIAAIVAAAVVFLLPSEEERQLADREDREDYESRHGGPLRSNDPQ